MFKIFALQLINIKTSNF